MLCSKCKCCGYMWWSGFFALIAGVHVLRLIFRPEIQIGGFTPPTLLSVIILVVAGALSLLFARLGCGSCNCGHQKTACGVEEKH